MAGLPGADRRRDGDHVPGGVGDGDDEVGQPHRAVPDRGAPHALHGSALLEVEHRDGDDERDDEQRLLREGQPGRHCDRAQHAATPSPGAQVGNLAAQRDHQGELLRELVQRRRPPDERRQRHRREQVDRVGHEDRRTGAEQVAQQSVELHREQQLEQDVDGGHGGIGQRRQLGGQPHPDERPGHDVAVVGVEQEVRGETEARGPAGECEVVDVEGAAVGQHGAHDGLDRREHERGHPHRPLGTGAQPGRRRCAGRVRGVVGLCDRPWRWRWRWRLLRLDLRFDTSAGDLGRRVARDGQVVPAVMPMTAVHRVGDGVGDPGTAGGGDAGHGGERCRRHVHRRGVAEHVLLRPPHRRARQHPRQQAAGAHVGLLGDLHDDNAARAGDPDELAQQLLRDVRGQVL